MVYPVSGSADVVTQVAKSRTQSPMTFLRKSIQADQKGSPSFAWRGASKPPAINNGPDFGNLSGRATYCAKGIGPLLSKYSRLQVVKDWPKSRLKVWPSPSSSVFGVRSPGYL